MGLDLSRIDAWTREMLEGEARRRGIRSPEFRTRGDLIRLILRHQYGDRFNAGRDRIAKGRRNLAQARELLGAAVGAALASLPEPFESLMRLRRRPLPRQPRPEVPSPPRVPTERATAPAEPRQGADEPAVRGVAPGAAPQPAPQPAIDGPREQAVAAETVTTQPPAPQPAETLTTQPPAGAAARRSGPTTRTFVEEPIRTRSMARLLAAQGHRERALAIYEELLGQNSEDPGLRDEAAAMRRGEPVEDPRLSGPPPDAIARASLPVGGDQLYCEGEPGAGLLLRWRITEEGEGRARAVLGRQGELAVRVICIRPDPEQVVRSEVTEHGPVEASGQWQAPALPSAVRCLAAVGLRDGARFVAIVHDHPGGKRTETPASSPPPASAAFGEDRPN